MKTYQLILLICLSHQISPCTAISAFGNIGGFGSQVPNPSQPADSKPPTLSQPIKPPELNNSDDLTPLEVNGSPTPTNSLSSSGNLGGSGSQDVNPSEPTDSKSPTLSQPVEHLDLNNTNDLRPLEVDKVPTIPNTLSSSGNLGVGGFGSQVPNPSAPTNSNSPTNTQPSSGSIGLGGFGSSISNPSAPTDSKSPTNTQPSSGSIGLGGFGSSISNPSAPTDSKSPTNTQSSSGSIGLGGFGSSISNPSAPTDSKSPTNTQPSSGSIGLGGFGSSISNPSAPTDSKSPTNTQASSGSIGLGGFGSSISNPSAPTDSKSPTNTQSSSGSIGLGGFGSSISNPSAPTESKSPTNTQASSGSIGLGGFGSQVPNPSAPTDSNSPTLGQPIGLPSNSGLTPQSPQEVDPINTMTSQSVFGELEMPGATLEEKIVKLEQTFCGNVCGSNFPRSSERWNKFKACEACQCDETCVRYNNCCPDMYLLRNVTSSEIDTECTRLSPTKFILSGSYGRDDQLSLYSTLITKCPTKRISFNATEEAIEQSKCENPNVSNLDEAIPVSDVTTNLTYANIYCAGCHNINTINLHQWENEISCNDPTVLLSNKPSKAELYQKLTSEDGVISTQCQITYFSDEKNTYRRSCRQPMLPVTTTCHNDYRTYEHYSEEIEKACILPSYTSQFNNRFKNIFCFMCQNSRLWTIELIMQYIARLGTAAQSVNMARLSFSALIDFSADHDGDEAHFLGNDVTVADDCSQTQFFDNATCSCKDIQCDEWRTFDPETKTCPGGFGSLGVGYRACLEVIVDFNKPPTFNSIERLGENVDSLVPTHKMMLTISKWCPGDTRLVLHLETWATYKKGDIYGDAYTDSFNADGNTLCNFIRGFSGKYIFDDASVEMCVFDMVEENECPPYDQSSVPCIEDGVNQVKQTIVTPPKIPDNRPPGGFGGFFNPAATKPVENVFFPYQKTDHCPFLEASVSRFFETGDTLVNGETLSKIDKAKVVFINNHTLIRICLDDLKHWGDTNATQCGNYVQRRFYDSTSFDTWTTAGLISIISSCISLFFLILTFITYLLFKELRTKGCVSIMILTVILFIAQGLYEFAIEQYENKTLCRIFGIMIHYFWLASIFSMNACTIERFVKLYFPLRSRFVFASSKPIVMATAYTFLCPCVIICCNIALNLAINNEFGYGSAQICYINERYSRIFSFVLPMCVILVVNVVLLIITVIKLRRYTAPGEKGNSKGSRVGLVACVRLSVITGGTWLISLLYEAIPVEALGYVFTALLGLQGVIFFFSLMGNRRILTMYMNLFRRESRQKSSAASMSTASTRYKTNDDNEKV